MRDDSEPKGVEGRSSSKSSNSGEERSISGEGLNCLRRMLSSASSEADVPLDNEGVIIARGCFTIGGVAIDTGDSAKGG